jgi:hypothetical protein
MPYLLGGEPTRFMHAAVRAFRHGLRVDGHLLDAHALARPNGTYQPHRPRPGGGLHLRCLPIAPALRGHPQADSAAVASLGSTRLLGVAPGVHEQHIAALRIDDRPRGGELVTMLWRLHASARRSVGISGAWAIVALLP